jgi:neprosin-like protein
MTSKFETFTEFMNSVQSAKPERFLTKKGDRAMNDDAFTEMKAYLIENYQGIEVLNSFVDENGSVFDCIPIEKQSALKGSGRMVPEAPDLPEIKNKPDANDNRNANQVESQLSPNRKDEFGNAMFCPPGTVPKRRITLDELARFGTMRHFFQKSPVGSGLPPSMINQSNILEAVEATHRYGHAYQNVDNLGGHSNLNIWNPSIDTGSGQIFSLSQHWYVGGSGPNLQTAEVGWQVYPQKYGHSMPVLFIYWTSDAYKNTGCYNLDCSAFVQTSTSWTIGGALSPVSVTDGLQYEIEVSFQLDRGLWWLYVGGTQSSNAIGYYPTSIYNNGAMASKASSIDYGGETVGTTSWPLMGSGRFAGEGYQKSAYQRNIFYLPTTGGSFFANLTASQPSPLCYTANVTSDNPPWNATLFYGGAGGMNC